MGNCETEAGATPLEIRRPSKEFVKQIIDMAGGENTVFAKTVRCALKEVGIVYSEDETPTEEGEPGT